jgi:hypothetical protein
MFPLPTLGPELGEIARELITGRGMVLIRGVPVERYSKERASAIYWGVGTHLGRPWPQNAKGHLLGDVTDQGRSVADPTARGNELGGIALPFHSDGSDLVGLFCLDAGAGGGDSLVANAVTMHNDLVRKIPSWPPPSTTTSPTTCGASSARVEELVHDADLQPARRPAVRPLHPALHRGVAPPRRRPPPTAAGRAAMDRLDALCADPQYAVAMGLRPGDMQFVNNYHVLHARDAYTDDRPAGKIRHLKRLWLETDVLTDDDKPERFRLTRGSTSDYWASQGRTKSTLDV